MGTSSANGGPDGDTPLVPTWLSSGGDGPPSERPAGTSPPDGPSPNGGPPVPPAPTNRPAPSAPPYPGRFQNPRNNLTRFARSGGSDRRSLGRALSQYVSSASGGARNASRRMGSSTRAGAGLLGFLTDVQARGAREALRALNLEGLAGRPIDEIFLGLANYICPDGGTVDEGIAREAFIETIVDLSELGVTDLDALSADQMLTVFELYATHAIEARICNDIGMKAITLPTNVHAAELVQKQLRDFVRRGVADALSAARATMDALTPDRVFGFVGSVYESAFAILQSLGNTEANA